MATIFEGDNGGATSAGVSATEIRVAVPGANFGSGPNVTRSTIDALFEYVNQRFELYGRRVVPVYVRGSASSTTNARALGADTAAAGVFAALMGYLDGNNHTALPVASVQEMARHGIVSIAQNRTGWWSDRLLFDAFHPYVWTVYPSAEVQQAQLASVACALASGVARHTSDPDLVGKPRKLAVVAVGNEVVPSASVSASVIENCTGQGVARVGWAQAADSSGTQLRTSFERLAADGVTSIVCICEATGGVENAIVKARQLDYFPEWIFPGTNYWGGEEWWGQQLIAGGWVSTGGFIRTEDGPRQEPLQTRPWYRAVLATNPQLVTGAAASLQEAFGIAEFLYPQLMVLAAGVQAAGPMLTAETFGAGLMTAVFPNVGAGQPPDYQPSVGFGPGDHGFFNDFSVSWWSPTAPAVEPRSPSPQGSWCYVGDGARFRPDTVSRDLDGWLNNAAAGCR